MSLKIGYGSGFWIFLAQPGHFCGQLVLQRHLRRGSEVTAAAAAENTAAGAPAPVEIRAGKTGVYRGFIELVSPSLVFKGQGMIEFVFISVGKVVIDHGDPPFPLLSRFV